MNISMAALKGRSYSLRRPSSPLERLPVKALIVAAAAASMIVTTAMASAQSGAQPARPVSATAFTIAIPSLHGLRLHRILLPRQSTGGTATPTSTGGGTPTPAPTASPTPTTSPYPDPVNLLQQSLNLFSAVRAVHFQDIYTGDVTNTEHLGINGTGYANCKPSMYAAVNAKDALLGTAQKATAKYDMIEIKGSTWKKNLKGKKHVWTKVKRSKTYVFGQFTIDNPLECPSTSSGGGSGTGNGSGGGSDQLTDLVNLGPATYHGIKTWHLQGTDVSTDAQGNTSQANLEFYISQSHALPYGYRVTIADATQNLTLSFEQYLSQFGKKVTVKAPKVGSRKP